jgi:hypothetical protein
VSDNKIGRKTADEVEGFEYDWLACDADDYVGFFSTAGGGYAPGQLLENTDRHDAAIKLILSLPVSTSAEFAPDLAPKYENTWRMVAERGLYAYDADFNGGPYRLVAVPRVPKKVGQFPDSISSVVRLLRLRGQKFSDRDEISGDTLERECGSP